MTLLIQEISGGLLLKPQGSATVENAADTLKAFSQVNLTLRNQVEIDLSDVTGADITFVQVLLSFVKSGKASGTRISCGDLPANHPLKDILELLGADIKRDFHTGGELP